ncbi:unnamed protein product [Rotaria socialis]|uniref:Uncharacterized protein n=3 Tax=Rotaria socialis TaxID=392032 RepID=A0A818G7A8_9BILA|nr:unnamed protein product [Rotaria socialis]
MVKMAGEDYLNLNINSSIEEICTKSNDVIDQDIFTDEFSLGAMFYLKDKISDKLISSQVFHIQYLIDNLKTNIEYCLSHYEDVNKKAGITYQEAFRNINAIKFRLFQEYRNFYIHYFLQLHSLSLSHRLPVHLLIYLSIEFSVIPLRGCSIDIHPNARWKQNGLTVAGGNGQGNGINQLSNPWGLYVDDDQTVYITDSGNHRIVERKSCATNGQVVAGGNEEGSEAHQLSYPRDVIVDKERDSLIICDRSNQRVVRWSRRNGTSRETIISNVTCVGLTMDENGSLYVVNVGNNEVRRYRRGESQGTVVAGGNGRGKRLDQLFSPYYVFVDPDHSVYVSDWGNYRAMKWMEGAKEGIVVADGEGKVNGLTQLSHPRGVVVDQLGTVYVADRVNHRIMRWPKGAIERSVIVGGNGEGGQSNQLNGPFGLSFDRYGNLYVVDKENHRVQKFNIEFNG